MKDVAALCRRVVIIALGRIIYDGSLGGHHRPLRRPQDHLAGMLNGEMPGGSRALRRSALLEPPRIKLRVDRSVVPEVLGKILATHSVVDVSVEDPPLEEVIAEMFSQANAMKDDVTPYAHSNLVDHPPHQPGRAAGLSGRFCPGHADAVPAHRDADLSLGGRVLEPWKRRAARATRSSAIRITT